MSSQAVTRALRDNKRSLDERSRIAELLLSQSFFEGEKVFLPKREMVILQWVFDLLGVDQKARESPAVWALLVQCWQKCDHESRDKLFQKSKFSQILASSMDKGPLANIDLAVKVISASSFIQFSNDQQACSFISGYYSQRTEGPHLEALISQLVGSRPKLFKGQIDMLPLLVNTQHLKAFLSIPGVDSLILIEEKDVPQVFAAIVASGVDVQSRFQWLSRKFPGSTPQLLELLSTKLDREVVMSLVEDQLEMEVPNWTVLTLLSSMYAEPLFDRISTVIDKLKTHWNEEFVLKLWQKYVQARRLVEFLVQLSKSFAAETLKHPALAEMLESSLKTLSAHQLVTLVQSLENEEWICLVVENMSYQNISKELETVLTHREASLESAYAVSALLPSSTLKIDIDPKNMGFAMLVYILRSKELYKGTLAREKHLQSWRPKGPQEANVLLLRFFPVIDTLHEKTVAHIVSHSNDCVSLFRNTQLLETRQVFPQLLAKAIKAADLEALSCVPMAILGKKDRTDVLQLAWSKANFTLLAHCLELPSKSAVQKYSAKDFFKLVKSLDAKEYRTLARLTCTLIENGDFLAKLQSHSWKFKTWQELVVASCLPNFSAKSELTEIVKSNLSKFENVELNLAVVDALGVDASEIEVGQIAISQPSSAVFATLCRQGHPWQSICAYFVHTGCIYVSELDSYLGSLTDSDFLALVLEAANGHYAIFQVACTHFTKEQKYVSIYTRMLIQVQAKFSALSEQQLLEFLELSEYVLREHSWLVTQYSLEAIIKLIIRIASPELRIEVTQPDKLHTDLCLVLSRILLFQRYRLHGRMPLIIASLTQMLSMLTRRKGKHAVNWLIPGVEHAQQFVRLVGNLCNPPQQSVRESSGKNSLTSSVAKARRYVAQHIGVLINNFVFLALQAGFETNVRLALQPACFAMMDTVGVQDFMSVASSLDAPGRAYLKPIYEEYKVAGKWTKD